MAVVKGTFSTNMRGRVGSVVYRNRGGVNVASQIPASVKNPQSLPQQQQRMKFNSVAQAYKCLKSIADHSFEGVTYGAPSQAKFMSDNSKLYTLDGQGHGFVAMGNSSIPPGNFKLSEGSLPQIGYHATDFGANPDNQLSAHNTFCFFDNPFTRVETDLTEVTVAQLLLALGVQKGDQVTLLVVRTKAIQYFGANNTIPQCIDTELVKASFTIALDAEDTALAFISNVGGTDTILNPAVLIESENINAIGWASRANGLDNYQLGFSTVIADWNTHARIAYGVIASRKVGTSWLRSTQYLDRVASSMWIAREHGTIPVYTHAFVVLTYDPKSPYYLNNDSPII